MTYKYDIGVYIVPKHIFEGQDWTTFKPSTSPRAAGHHRPLAGRLLLAEQKVIDRRDSWWAVDQGLVDAMPGVERIIYLPWTEESRWPSS